MDLILGVDGGGTRTKAWITNTSGKLLAKGNSGSGSYISVGTNLAIKNLNTSIFDAIKVLRSPDKVYFISSCFGFAGFNIPGDKVIYKKIVFNNKLQDHLNPDKCQIYNDTRIGLEAGSNNKNKIIIIAGTGSNCLGANENGKEARTNSWDYILADEGSGYEVSIKALRAVMRAFDGRGPKTILSRTIPEFLGLKNELDLLKWVYGQPFSKERIGSIARIVCEAAVSGDKVSQDILKEEAGEAVLSIKTVAKKLGLENKKFDLVMVGSLFKCKKYFKEIVVSCLKGKFGKIVFKELVENPVKGAIKLAIENLK